jgi:hypothetical protein
MLDARVVRLVGCAVEFRGQSVVDFACCERLGIFRPLLRLGDFATGRVQ